MNNGAFDKSLKENRLWGSQLIDPVFVPHHPHIQGGSIWVRYGNETRDQRHVGMVLKQTSLLLQPGWMRAIVGIHPRDPVAFTDFKSRVQSKDEPSVRTVEDTQPRIMSSELIEDSGGAIGRTIVDADDLEVGEGPTQDTLYRVLNRVFAIEDGKNHGDLGRTAQNITLTRDCCFI